MLKVSILGATGLVGQRLVQLLAGHKWFEIHVLAASERSAGKRYSEVVRWQAEQGLPEIVADMEVLSIDSKTVMDADVIFSSLPSEVAGRIEEDLARKGLLVISDAAFHRMDPYVPIINPEVNADHISLIDEQRKAKRWDGAIVTTPNCTVAILALSLKPILDEFGIESVIVSTMQAISGAGYPGHASLDLVDNVIPFIEGEEEKVEKETLKILGQPRKFADISISASCHRVPVLDGHLEAVFVKTKKAVQPQEVELAMREFVGEPQRLKLPTAPEKPIIVRREVDRPQPRLDRMIGKGLPVVVGRIRKDPVTGGVKYLVLGHNLIRGAAGCSVLTAELLKAKNYL